VDHGATQVFSAGLATRLTDRDVVRSTVILRDDRVVNGDIGGALFKITHWISTCGHNVSEKLIGLRHCTCWCVNEMSLHSRPCLGESCAIGRRKWAKVKFFNALCTFGKIGLGTPTISAFGNRAFVFRTEPGAETFGATALKEEDHDGAKHDHNGGNNDGNLRWG
jgi:hypothetical protein